jgi:hypothetical protein
MRRAVVLFALAGILLSGCELVADFDRSKIPVPDAGPAGDGGGDMPIEDAATGDAGTVDAGGGDDEDAGGGGDEDAGS